MKTIEREIEKTVIEKVTVYVADDETEFTKKYECQDYEEKLERKALLDSLGIHEITNEMNTLKWADDKEFICPLNSENEIDIVSCIFDKLHIVDYECMSNETREFIKNNDIQYPCKLRVNIFYGEPWFETVDDFKADIEKLLQSIS